MRLVRMMRVGLAALVAVFVVVGLASAAGATGYGGGATITLSTTHPACGSTVGVTGSGFKPNATVYLVTYGSTTSVTSDGTGSFSATVPTPKKPCGGAPVPIIATDGTNVAWAVYANGGTAPLAPLPVAATSPLPEHQSGTPATLARLAVLPAALVGYVLLTVRRRRAVKMPID